MLAIRSRRQHLQSIRSTRCRRSPSAARPAEISRRRRHRRLRARANASFARQRSLRARSAMLVCDGARKLSGICTASTPSRATIARDARKQRRRGQAASATPHCCRPDRPAHQAATRQVRRHEFVAQVGRRCRRARLRASPANCRRRRCARPASARPGSSSRCRRRNRDPRSFAAA